MKQYLIETHKQTGAKDNKGFHIKKDERVVKIKGHPVTVQPPYFGSEPRSGKSYGQDVEEWETNFSFGRIHHIDYGDQKKYHAAYNAIKGMGDVHVKIGAEQEEVVLNIPKNASYKDFATIVNNTIDKYLEEMKPLVDKQKTGFRKHVNTAMAKVKGKPFENYIWAKASEERKSKLS